MSEEEARLHDRRSRRRRVWKWIGIGSLVVVLLAATTLVVAYKKLQGNIHGISTSVLGNDRPDKPKVAGPQEPLNILIMGSDDRKGTNIGGETPGLSDTAILLHLSADRKRAYGISIPRDTMVNRPTCRSKDGKHDMPGGLSQFNAAFAVGGPLHGEDRRAHHRHQGRPFRGGQLAGFKDMVNAVHGVTVCVPTAVNDDIGHIHLPAGTYKVNGNQALDYVRVRHDLGAPNGDIGRMKRQQAFISAMIAKVYSAGTLTNPVRLFKFLDAATSSLTTDTAFANLKELASLGRSLKDIGLDKIKFITVPNQPWPQDPNRLVFAPGAADLWHKVRYDRPLGKLAADAVSPGGQQPGTPSVSPSPSQSGSPTATPTQDEQAQEAARKEAAREAGLCA